MANTNHIPVTVTLINPNRSHKTDFGDQQVVF